MQLEIKHLAPYLPYGLKAIDEHGKVRTIDWECQSYTNTIVGLNHVIKIQSVQVVLFKPMLKPISKLDELLRVEFTNYNLLAYEFSNYKEGENYPENYNEKLIDLFCFENIHTEESLVDLDLSKLPYNCIEYMFENHYDYFRLIDNGLAVEIK
jgi:hypothetical protein